MRFVGLPPAQVLTIMAIASALAVLLYLLRLRRRRMPVPFLPLWESLLAERRATRLWSQLKRLLSLLLALCIIALLSIALGDPRSRAGAPGSRHVVVLVDAGASMQAVDVAPSRLAVALEQARDVVQRAGPDVQMLVAQLDAEVTPLSPMTGDRAVLARALDAVEPVDARTRPAVGLSYALDVLRERRGAEIVLVSDGSSLDDDTLDRALADSPASFSFVPVGKRSQNLAITNLAVRRYPLDKSQSELLLELDNPTDAPHDLHVTLLGDGRPIDRLALTIEPHSHLRRFYDDISGVDRTLEARLAFADGSHDDLPLDDRAYAVVPARRRAKVLVVSPGNRYLEAALLLDEYLSVDQVDPSTYTDAAGYDVVIYDRFAPSTAPEVPALYLQPQGEGSPLASEGTIERPFFTSIDREHPLLRFTALRDVNIAEATRLRTEPGDQVVARDTRGPLIVAGSREGTRFVALAFDVRVSDLTLRVAWPILLLNCIDWFVGEDSGYPEPRTVGSPVLLGVGDSANAVALHGPGLATTLRPRDGHVAFVPKRAGIYQLGEAPELQTVAVNLGRAGQRDIAPRAALQRGGTVAPAPRLPSATWQHAPWALLLLCAIVLLTLEWLTYHRRWTV